MRSCVSSASTVPRAPSSACRHRRSVLPRAQLGTSTSGGRSPSIRLIASTRCRSTPGFAPALRSTVLAPRCRRSSHRCRPPLFATDARRRVAPVGPLHARATSNPERLQAAVALVMCIAAANIANLLLAVAAGRRKETGRRVALGATRVQLIADLGRETLLLAGAGAAAGALLAIWIVELLNGSLSYQNINRLEPFRVDSTVLLFTLGLAVASAVVFAVLPAGRAAGTDVVDALKDLSVRNDGRNTAAPAARNAYRGGARAGHRARHGGDRNDPQRAGAEQHGPRRGRVACHDCAACPERIADAKHTAADRLRRQGARSPGNRTGN